MFTLVFISDEEVYEVYLLSPKYKDCNIDFCMIVSWHHVASCSSVTPLYGCRWEQ